MAWEENSRICLHMQLIAILSRTGVDYSVLRYVSRKIDFIIVSHAKAILIMIIHTIRINLPSHFGYAILIIIDILQQKLKVSLCRTTQRNSNDRFGLNRPLS